MHRTEKIAIWVLLVGIMLGCDSNKSLVDLDRAITNAVPGKLVVPGTDRNREPIEAVKGGPGRRLMLDLYCKQVEIKFVVDQLLITIRQEIGVAGLEIVDEDLQRFDGQLVGFTYYLSSGKCQIDARVCDRNIGQSPNGPKLFRLTVSIRGGGLS